MFSPYFDLGIMDKYFIANVHDATPKNLKLIPNLFCHFFFWCLKKKSMLNFYQNIIYITCFSNFFYHYINFFGYKFMFKYSEMIF